MTSCTGSKAPTNSVTTWKAILCRWLCVFILCCNCVYGPSLCTMGVPGGVLEFEHKWMPLCLCCIRPGTITSLGHLYTGFPILISDNKLCNTHSGLVWTCSSKWSRVVISSCATHLRFNISSISYHVLHFLKNSIGSDKHQWSTSTCIMERFPTCTGTGTLYLQNGISMLS